jgi:hypothetical protein
VSSSAEKPLPVAPATLRAAIGLLYAQAAGLAAVAVWLVAKDLRATSDIDTRIGWAVAISALFGAALLGGYAWALGRRWALVRGLAVGTEIIFMAPAYYMVTGGRPLLGAVIGALCVVTVGALVAPPTNRALYS